MYKEENKYLIDNFVNENSREKRYLKRKSHLEMELEAIKSKKR